MYSSIQIGESSHQPAAAPPPRRIHRTIQDVLDDPAALRRQAVLATISDFFPAYNVGSGAPRFRIGQDTGQLDQGPWVQNYLFPGTSADTSCTTVNPGVMGVLPHIVPYSYARNDSIRWGFNAGPTRGSTGNPAWRFCNSRTLPRVGDTYIVLNAFQDRYFGHVGIVLEVPPSGNGLWVTADGGQQKRPAQHALIVPRWGLMGAVLPAGGDPPGVYRAMQPENDAGPFLGGGYASDVHSDAPLPGRHDDVPRMIRRIAFRPKKTESVPNPRRMDGFVDIDSPALRFEVDDKPMEVDHWAKTRLLKAKVDRVIAAYLAGGTLSGVGT
jgi:hypothetical protein